MDANLTLEKAKQAVRQKEAVVEHGRQLQGSGNSKRDPIELEEANVIMTRSQTGTEIRPPDRQA